VPTDKTGVFGMLTSETGVIGCEKNVSGAFARKMVILKAIKTGVFVNSPENYQHSCLMPGGNLQSINPLNRTRYVHCRQSAGGMVETLFLGD
jgi:hypothetical protein